MQEVAIEERTASDLRWNFSVNLLDITFITLGLSLISRETVIPALVNHLTDSKLAIGLIPAIWSLGFYLPQLFTANFSEGLRYKKPFVLTVGGLGERLPYLLVGLAVWGLALPAPNLALLALLVGLGMAATSAGIATPAWFDMIAKVIPVQRRGIWSGLGHSLGAMLGIAGALLAGQVLDRFAYPVNFAILFVVAFVAVAISWLGLSLTREPPSPVTREPEPIRRYLVRLPGILRRDPNYRRFLIGRTTVQLGTMAVGFFMVYGIERFGIEGTTVGTLTAVLVGSQAVMNLAWGVIGDRLGHKTVLTSAAFGIAVAAFVAWQAPSPHWLVPVFVLVGAYLAADMVSGLNIILEFCAPHERPTYIGLTNTLLAPVVTLAPLLGGWLATWMGYGGLFAVAATIATLGALLFSFWVREPRGRPT